MEKTKKFLFLALVGILFAPNAAAMYDYLDDPNYCLTLEEELIEACIDGNTPEVQRLLENDNINVNAGCSHAGETALHYATYKGNIDLCNILLSHNNIDVNKTNNDDKTVLHIAAKNGSLNGSLAIVRALLRRPETQVNAQDKNNRTPLHIAYQSFQRNIIDTLLADPRTDFLQAFLVALNEIADGSGSIETIEDMAKDASPERFLLLLHLTCKNGNPDALRAVLNTTENININQPNQQGQPPLYIAYLNGNKKLANQLLRAPAINLGQFSSPHFNVNAQLATNQKPHRERPPGLQMGTRRFAFGTGTFLHAGDTLLHVAIKNNDLAVFRALLNNPTLNPNIENSHGYTPLTLAYSSRHINRIFLEELIGDHRVNLNAGRETILSQAVASADTDTVYTLLQQRNLDTNAPEPARYATPLLIASRHGYKAIVTHLLAHPNTNPYRQNNWGEIPLFVACFHGNVEIVEKLIDHIISYSLLDSNQKIEILQFCKHITDLILGANGSAEKTFPHQQLSFVHEYYKHQLEFMAMTEVQQKNTLQHKSIKDEDESAEDEDEEDENAKYSDNQRKKEYYFIGKILEQAIKTLTHFNQ